MNQSPRKFWSLVSFVMPLILSGWGSSATAPPARSFVRTDAPPVLTLFDPVHRVVYATVPALNELAVISSVQHAITNRIAIPGAFSMDLSPDGTQLLVGSGSDLLGGPEAPMLTLIDTGTLQIVGRFQVPVISGVSLGTIPMSLAWTSNGTVLIVAQQVGTTGFDLIQWDPVQNSFRTRSLPNSVLPQQVVRSGDHSKALLSDSSTSGANLVLYDANVDDFVATGFADGIYPVINSDGSMSAVAGAGQLLLFDGGLNMITSLAIDTDGQKPLFSVNGKSLYVEQGYLNQPPSYLVLDTATFMPIGEIPAFTTPTGFNQLASLDGVDDAGELFGVLDRGVSFDPYPISATPLPYPLNINNVQPTSGQLANPAPTTINGVGLAANSSVFFGNQPATAVTVGSTGAMNVTPPSSPTTGPVDVTVEPPGGNVTMLPQGYTFGPSVLYIQNNAGSTAGGSLLQIMGYGFDFNSSQIEVSIGGQPAILSNVTGIGISPFLLPLQRIYAHSPPGAAGPADVTVTTPNGTSTLHNGYTYYSFSSPTGPTATGEMVYDPSRQVLYVTDDVFNQVDVVSPGANAIISTLPCGQGPLGIALSPDHSKLVVTNWNSQSISVIDIASKTQHEVALNFNGNGPGAVHPAAVAVANNGKALIGAPDLSLLDNADLLELDLSSLQLSIPSNVGGLYLTSDLELHAFAEGSKIWVAAGTGGGSSGGGGVIWIASTDTFARFVDGIVFFQSNITDNGLVFDASGNFYNSTGINYSFVAPLDLISYPLSAVGEKLHPGGGLLFTPVIDGVSSTITVSEYDVNTGWLLNQIEIPGNPGSSFDTMVFDDTGNRLFVSTDTGIITIDLSSLPVSIGSIAPTQGLTTGGDTLVLRGSNLQKGAAVNIRGVSAATTWVDQNTVQAVSPPMSAGQVPVKIVNPDGSSYTLPAAFTYVSSIPTVSATYPAFAQTGTAVALTVFGTSFVPGSVIRWNGGDQTTTFVDNNTLQTIVATGTVGTQSGTASLTVRNPDGAVSSIFPLPLSYPPPELNWGTDSFDFGPQLVNTPSTAFSTDLANYGDVPFTPSITMTGDFSQTNDCPTTLQPHTSCTALVTFTPSIPGVHMGKLIAIAPGVTSQVIALSGRGIPPGPALTSTPYSFDFGKTIMGSAPPPQYQINVYSVGSIGANISSVSVPEDYQVSQNTCQGALAVNSWCYVFLTFAPSVPGTRPGALTVTSNAADSPLTVPLTGVGLQPFTLNPTSLIFGPQIVGTTNTQQITVQNQNKTAISAVGGLNPPPNFDAKSNCGENIYPGTSCTLTVSFTPGLSGSLAGILSVWEETGGLRAMVNVPVSGSGVDFGLALAAGASNTSTINRGQTTTYALSLNDSGYTGTAIIACAGAPALASCTPSPNSAALGGSASRAITVTVQTQAPAAALAHRGQPANSLRPRYVSIAALLLVPLMLLTSPQRRSRSRGTFARLLLLSFVLVLASCGGSGTGSGGGGGSGGAGTPVGSYQLQVTATAGGITRNVPLTLIVK